MAKSFSRLIALAIVPSVMVAAALSSGQAQPADADCYALHQKATVGALSSAEEQRAYQACVLSGDIGRELDAAEGAVSASGDVLVETSRTGRPINPFVLNSWSTNRPLITPSEM